MSLSPAILVLSTLIVAASLEAALDFEGAVPGNWTENGNGSLSISSDHYRLGSESLQWSWQGGDVLTAQGVSIDASKVLDFYNHTCDLWIYSDTDTAGEALTIEFLDGSNNVQWRFTANLNYLGWRHLLRSYKYDMEQVGGGTDLQAVRFIAPTNGSGNLFFDDLEWVRDRVTRQRDRVMPDISGYYADTLWHDLENLPPDLSPTPATSTELAALPQIDADYWDSAAGGDPGSSAVTNAKSAFTNWNIVRGTGFIKGNPVDKDSIDDIDDFLGVLAREWHHDADTQARDMAIDTVEHMLDQGWAGGSAESTDGGSSTYGTREVLRALLLLRNDFSPTTRAAVKDLLEWRLKKGFFWDPNIDTNKNTDYIHTESLSLMGLVLGYSDTDQEKVENLRGLKQYFERFIAISPGTANGIKPDGTGFHHWNHYNNYMYAFGQLSDRLYVLRNSPFQINQASYETFRDSCYLMGLMSNEVDFGLGFSGRKPADSTLSISKWSFAHLAKAGGSFYGQSADPKIARFYNRVWGTDSSLSSYGSEAFPTGFWQLNYSPAGIYRTGNTVVSLKGLTDTFWGTEIYSTSNRYGRYQSYGSVEVLYPGGRDASGFSLDGWDWNSPPGATTVQLPLSDLEASKSRQDELSQTRMAGALSVDLEAGGEFGVKGRYGLFGMKFQQAPITATHNDSFTFQKSVFAFDGKILCLGSNIANDDTTNETTTTLFQGVLPTTSTPTVHQGNNLNSFPLNTSWSTGSRWFLDHIGTGYYLPGNQEVKLARAQQTSPSHTGNGSATTEDYAKAWISHGNAPSNQGYEYVVLPESSSPTMTNFAADMNGATPPYTVLQKDTSAHIVHLRDENAHGYVCFEANPSLTHGPVMETTGSALISTQQTEKYLTINYANPELDLAYRSLDLSGIVVTDVRLTGNWVLDSGDSRAEIFSQVDDSTVLRFSTRHGLPVELGLLESTGYSDWQASHFNPTQLANPLISGPNSTPANDNVPNLFKYAWGLAPFVPTDLTAHFPVTFDDSEMIAIYMHDRSRPDVILQAEISTNLLNWSPLAGALVDSTLGVDTWQIDVPVGSETQQFLRLSAQLLGTP